jgi:hypothetical protein
MIRRMLTLGILLAVLCYSLTTTQRSYAENDDNSDRNKTVEINVTQYVWHLVSNRTGQVICEITVEHTNRPTYQETITICAEEIFPPEPTAQQLRTPTPGPGVTLVPSPSPPEEPFDLAEFFQTVSYQFVNTQELVRTVQVSVAEMVVNLVVPPNPVGALFISIYAYEPIQGESITEIRGSLNGWEFTCPSSRCDVLVTSDASLEFWALSSFGDESKHMKATLRVVTTDPGKRVEVSSLAPLKLYQDACAADWGISSYMLPGWASFPAQPDDLNTIKPYQYLAGKLLFSGIVKAPDCPGGGLMSSGAPNACGLDAASQAVIDWQNQFDLAIWDTSRTIGIPPRILKTLIEQESQFWPANARRLAYEYGLGQLSQAGADVVLRYDNELFNTVCNGLLYDCSVAYGRLPSWAQATLRGGLMKLMDSECATCANGVDLAHAQESIPILARTLRANCRQVKYIMDTQGLDASYEDLWKLTLLTYHSGYSCLDNALDTLRYNEMTSDWENISVFVGCPGGSTYVNDSWKSLQEFDLYRAQHPEKDQVAALATFLPRPSATPAPTIVVSPTPTAVRSLAHILVLVYIDKNGNNYPEDNERVNDIAVWAEFDDGSVVSAQTVKGEAVFDLTGRSIGGNVTILLPDLYRTQKVRVKQDGEIPVIFRLVEPVVPPVLP